MRHVTRLLAAGLMFAGLSLPAAAATPQRASTRCPLRMLAKRTRFSPAGPMARVPTATPRGIWTMDNRLSLPLTNGVRNAMAAS